MIVNGVVTMIIRFVYYMSIRPIICTQNISISTHFQLLLVVPVHAVAHSAVRKTTHQQT